MRKRITSLKQTNAQHKNAKQNNIHTNHFANEYDHTIKIILIGDSNVGKSSFLLRYADDEFNDSHTSTIGIDFKTKFIVHKYLGNNKIIKQQIWDTAGQEKFRIIVNSYYRGAYFALLFFDFTNIESFGNLSLWIDDIKKFNTETLIIVIGTKADLESNYEITDEMINGFVKQNPDIQAYYKVSAKSGLDIDVVFNDLNNIYLNKINTNKLDTIILTENTILNPQNSTNINKSRLNCC